jgi:hypothetical protein
MYGNELIYLPSYLHTPLCSRTTHKPPVVLITYVDVRTYTSPSALYGTLQTTVQEEGGRGRDEYLTDRGRGARVGG